MNNIFNVLDRVIKSDGHQQNLRCVDSSVLCQFTNYELISWLFCLNLHSEIGFDKYSLPNENPSPNLTHRTIPMALFGMRHSRSSQYLFIRFFVVFLMMLFIAQMPRKRSNVLRYCIHPLPATKR